MIPLLDNVRDNFDSESESEEVVDTKPTTTEPKKPSTTSTTDTAKPKTKRPKKPKRTEKPEEEEGGSILTYATPVLLLAATGLIVFSVYKYVWANKNK